MDEPRGNLYCTAFALRLILIFGDKNEYLFITKTASACCGVWCNLWNGIGTSSDVARLSLPFPHIPDLLLIRNSENSLLVVGIFHPLKTMICQRGHEGCVLTKKKYTTHHFPLQYIEATRFQIVSTDFRTASSGTM